MNKERRKRVKDVIDAMENIRATLEEIITEEQEAFNNLPESIQTSDKGEAMENGIMLLEEVMGSMEDASQNLEELS